jgi:hypothetical protein
MSSDVNYEDVLNEAVDGNGGKGTAVAPPPLQGRKAGESYKLVAPGTKPIGPRHAGALVACGLMGATLRRRRRART